MKCNPSAPRAALWLALASGLVALALPAAAAQQTVVEELLEILREEGKISDARYEDMKQRYQEEQRAPAKTPAVSAAPEDDSKGWKVRWKNGTRIERKDGYHKIKIGGRVQNDWAAIFESAGLEGRNSNSSWITGTEFRRARLFVSGTLFDRLIFKAQYDFADEAPEFKDVYMGLTKLGPLDEVRVGHFKVPFGLEQLTSSKYITFMERALPAVFDEARDTGLAVRKTFLDKRMTLTVGGFAKTDDFGSGFGPAGNYDVSMRVTGLPLWQGEGEGEQLVHLGLGYFHGFRGNADVRIRQRPEMHMADRLLDTGAGNISGVTGVDAFGPEVAWVHGPFSLQGEFKGGLYDRNRGQKDLWFHGGYAEASYFITGEHRAYKQSTGVFDRVTPIHSFNPAEGHWGAFQVAARYSHLDLNDEEIFGGVEDNLTLGANWHLFSNARISLNYVWGHVRTQGNVNGVQTRFQIDF